MASTLLEPELDDKDALFQKLLLNAAVCMGFLCIFSLLTLCLLLSSADNLCKQFGSRSGLRFYF